MLHSTVMTLEAIQDYLENIVFYPTVEVQIAPDGDLSIKDFYVCEFGHKWICTDHNYENGKAKFYCEELNGYLHGVLKSKQTYMGEVFNFVISYCE